MGRNSTFAALVDREVRRRMAEERATLLQMAKDAADMAANAVFSMGETRVPAWDAEYARAFNWIIETTEEDHKDDKNLWYTKTKMDEVLQRIRGKHFVPWKQRY